MRGYRVARCKNRPMPSHQDNAESFDAAAEAYARSRPGYPSESIDWLLDGISGTVVDLGAGTGLLTRSLVDRVDTVIAVEPSDNMRDQLSKAMPVVRAVRGTGESMTLDDASADAVLVAQAWHWVDVPVASAEVARVLRPGGRLGLIWNLRDESVPWVKLFSDIMDGQDAAGWAGSIRALDPAVGPEFGPIESHTTTWTQTLTVDGLVDLLSSRSYIITMSDDKRRQVLDDVRDLANDVAVDGTVELPYRTFSFRAPRGAA